MRRKGHGIVSTTLEIVLKLAAHETVAAQYREITPAHLLIALSRFSNTEEFAEVDPEASAAVRKEFEGLGIDPKRFRRRLRGLLGNGGAENHKGVIHRSPSCKAIFAVAEHIAQSSGSHFSMHHLVCAAFVALGIEGLADDHSQDSRPDDVPSSAIPDEL